MEIGLDTRIRRQELMLLEFEAKHNLSLDLTPRLIELAQNLAADKPALESLSLNTESACCKLKYGMADTFRMRTLKELRTTPFTLYFDSATHGEEKVVAMLASYFSEARGRLCMQHLHSFVCNEGGCERVYMEVDKLFTQHSIPWCKLVTVMMDSSKVLGERKSRLVRLLRDSKASHLLDVDGDVYYHAERCIQAFSAPFRQHPEQLLADLSADFRSSSRSCEFLQDICTALGTEFSLPVPYRSGQWLSTLDGAKRLDALFNPLLVYYFSFLSDSQGVLYQGMMEGVLDTTGCQASDKDMVRQIQSCVKHMFDQCTGEDRERKVRITSRLFVHHDTTLLILSLYTHVLSILHKLLDFFQRPGPILHQFYNYQHQVVQEFLACFVQPECRYLKDVNLQGLDLSDEDTLLPADQLNVGPTARQLIQRLPQHHLVTQTFLHQSLQAYRTCGRLLLRNMPLANQTLKCFRSLGPKMRCSNRRAGETNLGRVLSPVLVPREQYSIEDEVYWFCTDRQVPVTHHGERVDKWWARVFTTTSFYPTLEKCVLTLLSCFHGPLLQPALSITANVVEKGTHTVDIETLSAMHTVQYALQADNAGEASFFATTNLLTNSLGPAMLTNMRSAWKKNEEMEMAKWEERKKRASKRPASDVSPTENKRQPQPPTPE